MNQFTLVGISGKLGTGKDYIAQHALIPLGFSQFSLAWHFKVFIVGTGEATYEEVFVTKPPHVRKLLQLRGTEEGRMVFGEDVWCRTLLTWAKVLNENCGIDKFVVPDVRFPNEVQFIQQAGGKVYRIYAPERDKNSGASKAARQHISETALDKYEDFDGIIFNDPSDNGVLQTTELVVKHFPHVKLSKYLHQ